MKRALFIDMRRTEHLGQHGGNCNTPGRVEIVCGQGRVGKKIMETESQSPGVGLAEGKREVCIMGVILLHL